MTEAQRKHIEESLWQLHAELTKFFLTTIRNKDSKIKASMVGEIVSFLSHNGINIQNKRMMVYGLQELKGESEALELPFPGEGNA